jgi:hypothetical protein
VSAVDPFLLTKIWTPHKLGQSPILGGGKRFSDYHYPDERDGAGVPNADRIINGVGFSTYVLHPTDFNSSQKKIVGSTYVSTPGTRIRAVIAWNNCPDGYQTYRGIRAMANNWSTSASRSTSNDRSIGAAMITIRTAVVGLCAYSLLIGCAGRGIDKARDATVSIADRRPTDSGSACPCPISSCTTPSPGELMRCDCCNRKCDALETRACSVVDRTCHTFSNTCLPDGYQYCFSASGPLLTLCTQDGSLRASDSAMP